VVDAMWLIDIDPQPKFRVFCADVGEQYSLTKIVMWQWKLPIWSWFICSKRKCCQPASTPEEKQFSLLWWV